MSKEVLIIEKLEAENVDTTEKIKVPDVEPVENEGNVSLLVPDVDYKVENEEEILETIEIIENEVAKQPDSVACARELTNCDEVTTSELVTELLSEAEVTEDVDVVSETASAVVDLEISSEQVLTNKIGRNEQKPEITATKSYGRRGFKYGCYRFVKRTFDIIASGLFLIIFSWLYLILAIAVKVSDGGKVFYKHKRVGKHGKEIFVPKFRSMKKNADKLEDMLTPEQLEQYKREYKVDDDPRITKLGKFLRKTSLDELPNVWSIFKGDLSVIGPRPLMRSEVDEKYGEDADKLLSVKPGMIGWWASNGRSNCTYESGKRQEMELYYVDHCSIWLDIKIIFKTIIGVFKRDGAK